MIRTGEAIAGYKGMFPKRAGKDELGDAERLRTPFGLWSKNEASLHAYSPVPHVGDRLAMSPRPRCPSCDR